MSAVKVHGTRSDVVRKLTAVITIIICLVWAVDSRASTLHGDGGHRFLPCPASVVLSRAHVHEGSTVTVTVLPGCCPVTAATVSGPGGLVDLLPEGSTYSGYYPLPLGTAAGTQRLTVQLSIRLRSPLILTVPITVAQGQFPVQHLAVTAGMTALTTQTDRIAADRDLLAQAYSNSAPIKLWSGPFIAPTAGRISTVFGHRRYVGGSFSRFHYGVDIAAPAGTPVLAVNCGRVVLARDLVLQGGTVIIDHGRNLYSIYYHLSEWTVDEGQTIQRGDQIGAVGSTGYSTGPHLHWGFTAQGIAVNPADYLGSTGPKAAGPRFTTGDRP